MAVELDECDEPDRPERDLLDPLAREPAAVVPVSAASGCSSASDCGVPDNGKSEPRWWLSMVRVSLKEVSGVAEGDVL